jgi:probable rRNA maturation factor
MSVDTVIEHAPWQASLPDLSQRAFDYICAHFQLSPEFEVCVMGCDDERIAALNTQFRGKPVPTNVLSWPSDARAPIEEGTHPDLPVFSEMDPELGDIAIAYETCVAEADAQHKPFDDHVLHLLVHGFLHLLGYDHISDADAAVMERIEVKILKEMNIPDPYGLEDEI